MQDLTFSHPSCPTLPEPSMRNTIDLPSVLLLQSKQIVPLNLVIRFSLFLFYLMKVNEVMKINMLFTVETCRKQFDVESI